MTYKKYNFNKKDIEIAILKTKTDEEKLDYMLFLKKELDNVIYAFENTVLLKYREENKNCEFRKASELAKFIEDLKYVIEVEVCDELNYYIVEMKHDAERYFYKTTYYKGYYSKEFFDRGNCIDDDIGFGIRELGKDVEEDLKKYRITQKFLQTGIEYLKEKKLIGKEDKSDNGINNQTNRVNWDGTKSEFARMIVEEYQKNTSKYRSMKQANDMIFAQYSFDDKKFTKEKCYDLVRKV